MITEDYISFETAKLLKEKGFKGRMHTFYTEKGTEMESAYVVPSNFFPIYCPTLQMAMKWLREKYSIHVVPKFDFYSGDYTGRIYDGRRDSASERDNYIAITAFGKYEEAADAAIKYCLEKLI